MRLNLPSAFTEDLAYSNGLIIAGIGGGFDVFGGLPLAYELETHYNFKKIVFVSYSLDHKGFYSKEAEEGDGPEWGLAKHTGKPVYIVAREGVQTVRRAYEDILRVHNYSRMILVDGGFDSLMRGDEEGRGTVLEDAISMTAIAQLNPHIKKTLVCMGFGCEVEEGVSHYQALENIAELTKAGHFKGCCALTKEMESYSHYEDITHHVMNDWKRQSHIHSRIIPAVQGEFGNYHMYNKVDARVEYPQVAEYKGEIFVNPLMALMWFFDFQGVIERNLIAPKIHMSGTYVDAQMLYRQSLDELGQRKAKRIPIP